MLGSSSADISQCAWVTLSAEWVEPVSIAVKGIGESSCCFVLTPGLADGQTLISLRELVQNLAKAVNL